MEDASKLWEREVAMWEGIVETQFPPWSEGGPWATPAERRKRVEHVALVIAHRLSLSSAEGSVADELVRKGRSQ